jgi:hypothetical protein
MINGCRGDGWGEERGEKKEGRNREGSRGKRPPSGKQMGVTKKVKSLRRRAEVNQK